MIGSRFIGTTVVVDMTIDMPWTIMLGGRCAIRFSLVDDAVVDDISAARHHSWDFSFPTGTMLPPNRHGCVTRYDWFAFYRRYCGRRYDVLWMIMRFSAVDK